MVDIIKAYNGGGEGVANTLAKMAQGIFGDEAHNEVYRQTAKEKQRQNAAAAATAQAYRDNNAVETGAQQLLFNPGATNLGSTSLARRSIVPGVQPDDQQMQTLAIGAGHPARSTFSGMREEEGNRRAIEEERTRRAADTQLRIDERTLTPIQTPDGRIIQVPKSQVAELQRQGHTAVVTPDQVVGGMMQRSAQQQPQQYADTAPPPGPPTVENAAKAPPAQAPAASPANPFAHLPDAIRHKYNLNGEAPKLQSFLDSQTGEVMQSSDGGKTLIIDGHSVPLAGTVLQNRFQPIGNEQAVTQAQDKRRLDRVSKPFDEAPTQRSQAEKDAATLAGPFAIPTVQRELNSISGFFGGGEVGADINRARNNLKNLTNTSLGLLEIAPGHASVFAKKLDQGTIPQENWLGATGMNAQQQAQKVRDFTTHLRGVREMVQKEASDPLLDPKTRADREGYVRRLSEVIKMWEAGTTPPAQGQQQPNAAAPQQNAPAQMQLPQGIPPAAQRKPGVYSTPKGPMQWTGTGWLPAK